MLLPAPTPVRLRQLYNIGTSTGYHLPKLDILAHCNAWDSWQYLSKSVTCDAFPGLNIVLLSISHMLKVSVRHDLDC